MAAAMYKLGLAFLAWPLKLVIVVLLLYICSGIGPGDISRFTDWMAG